MPAPERNSLTLLPGLKALACVLALAGGGMALPASAFGGVHKLTCAGPGEARFLLSSSYTRRLWQAGSDSRWTVRYRMPGRRQRLLEVPGSLTFSGEDDAPCHLLGLVDGFVMVDKSFLQKDGRWFETEKLPRSFWFTSATAIELGLHKQLVALDVVPHDQGFLLPRQGVLVYEVALIAAPPRSTRVVAVVQSSSADGGQHWTPLALTTDARIYQLGTALEAQPFVARLLR
jgi:hypothetical protein